MSLRILALVTAIGALFSYAALLRPTKRAFEREEALYEEARAERTRVQKRLSALEHAQARRPKEGAMPPGDALPIRRAIVSCFERASVTGLRVDVRTAPGGTSIGLSGVASLLESLRVLGELLAPDVGVVPRQLHLAPVSEGVAFELQGERQP
jgi:hypothetical protein